MTLSCDAASSSLAKVAEIPKETSPNFAQVTRRSIGVYNLKLATARTLNRT
jgi:hypothetical protein